MIACTYVEMDLLMEALSVIEYIADDIEYATAQKLAVQDFIEQGAMKEPFFSWLRN